MEKISETGLLTQVFQKNKRTNPKKRTTQEASPYKCSKFNKLDTKIASLLDTFSPSITKPSRLILAHMDTTPNKTLGKYSRDQGFIKVSFVKSL